MAQDADQLGSMSEDQLGAMSEEEWGTLYKRLLLYTHKRYGELLRKDSIDLEEVVQEALAGALEGRRQYHTINKQKTAQENRFLFLCDMISSIISHSLQEKRGGVNITQSKPHPPAADSPPTINVTRIELEKEKLSEPVVMLKTVRRLIGPARGAEMEAKLKALLDVGKETVFEEGVENEFSAGLISLVNEYGADFVSLLADFIVDGRVNEEAVAEALRWFGRLKHPPSYGERLSLLEEALSNTSARIRDAAAVSLAALEDRHAMPFLRQAIQRESSSELREDMQQILESLESTL